MNRPNTAQQAGPPLRRTLLPALALACASLFAHPATAQTCSMIEINGVGPPISSNPVGARSTSHLVDFVRSGSYWYFVADHHIHGQELWRTDGTPAGTVMVKDINPGPADSGLCCMTSCRLGGVDVVLLRADDGVTGSELWRSDGTEAGTYLVRDIDPGAGSSSPIWFAQLGGRVYFSASDSVHGWELWASDGTTTGTVLVRDIDPGLGSSSPTALVTNSAGSEIYFHAYTPATGSELWRTDGTPAGTALIADNHPGPGGAPARFPVNHAGRTLFVASDGVRGEELWVTDGTAAGTSLLRDINPGGAGSDARLSIAVALGNDLLFAANDGTGLELWKTDGTSGGTVRVKDIFPGPTASFPQRLHKRGATCYFVADDGVHGAELWKTDGTAAGTMLVADIAPGAEHGNPNSLANSAGGLVFAASNQSSLGNNELWVTDGTSAGTTLLADLFTGMGSSDPEWMTELGNGHVLFAASASEPGGADRELWATLGLAGSTVPFADLDPATTSPGAGISEIHRAFADTVLFGAEGGPEGPELWAYDSGGARLVKDIYPGRFGSNPVRFFDCCIDGRAITLFIADDGTSGELWATDGTGAGTYRVADINPGFATSWPTSHAQLGSQVFFGATSGRDDRELWVTDATTAGTRRVADIWPGTSGSYPLELVAVGDKILFSAGTAAAGRELWCSDGTSAGTQLVLDIMPGAADSRPESLLAIGDQVFFAATDPNLGRELWVSDGTAAGTHLVLDIGTTFRSGDPSGLVEFRGKAFFAATRRGATELWCSDGTAAGTVVVGAVSFGLISVQPRYLTPCGDLLFYSGRAVDARGQPLGTELYATDGTAAGTYLVSDIVPGSGSSSPRELRAVGRHLYFSATTPASGRELWYSDGTASGTMLVCDLAPGSGSASPQFLTNYGGELLFVATDPLSGAELHMLRHGHADRMPLGPGRPSIDATPPALGGPLQLFGSAGPAAHIGAVLLSLPVAQAYPVPGIGCGWIDLPSLAVAGLVQPGTWSATLFVPANSSLTGMRVNAQSVWLGPALLPITAGAGVRLHLGN